MFRNIVFVFCMISASVCVAQKFSLELGAGVGYALGDSGISPTNSPVRGLLLVGGYINLGPKGSIGLETSTSFPLRIIFDDDGTREVNGTTVANPAPNAVNAVLLRGTFDLREYKGVIPYVALGVGSITYVTRNSFVARNADGETQRIKQTSLAFQPEIGIKIEDFFLSLRYRFAGRTPGFEGFDAEAPPQRTLIESVRLSPVYATFIYRPNW